MPCTAWRQIKKSTPQAGLRTILGLTLTEEVIRKRGLESFLRNRPNIKSQWDGTGHSNKTGFLKKWKKVVKEIAGKIFRNDEPINLVTSISTAFLNSPISRREMEAKAKKSLTNFAGLRVGRSLFKKKKFTNVVGAISKFDLQKQIVVQLNQTIIFTKSHPETIKDKINLNILDRRKIDIDILRNYRWTQYVYYV